MSLVMLATLFKITLILKFKIINIFYGLRLLKCRWPCWRLFLKSHSFEITKSINIFYGLRLLKCRWPCRRLFLNFIQVKYFQEHKFFYGLGLYKKSWAMLVTFFGFKILGFIKLRKNCLNLSKL
jgi:hypothetical protein